MPLNFSSALRPCLSILHLFLVRTALDIAKGHRDEVKTLGHLCMALSKTVLATDEMVLILFSALPF